MLIGFTLLSELVYLFLFSKAHQFGLLDLHNSQHLLWVIASLGILLATFYLAYYFLNWSTINIKAVFLVVFIFNITFLFIPYLSSNDLYSYIFTTRVNGIFGENPYFIAYDSFPQDPLYGNLKTIWAEQKTLYGPLFLYIGGFINLLGQNNLLFLTLAFKSLFIGANLINAFLIYQITKNKRAVFLFAANPLVVFELSGNSHTESITLLFLLLSFYFYRRPVVGFLSFVASVLFKYYPLVFLPLYLIKLKKMGLKTLWFSLGSGLLLTILIYLPFWRGLENFDYLLVYYSGHYISPSPLIALGEKLLGSYQLSFQINTVIFLLVALVIMIKFYLSKTQFKEFIFFSFLLYWTYILTKSSLILPWYLILLVLFGSLCITWRRYQKYALSGIVFASIYSLLLYYFVH